MESSDLVAFIASGCGAFSDVFVIMHLYFRAVRGARVTYRGYSFGRLGNGQVGEEFSGWFGRVWRDFRRVGPHLRIGIPRLSGGHVSWP